MTLDSNRLLVIAGPCLVESREIAFQVADHLCTLAAKHPIQLVFKGSYRKANRTSAASFQGIGDEEALSILADIRTHFKVPVLTDIHADAEAALAAEYVDVLQIPAFLSRQTSLLESAARTGKTVNIKKAQFMAPEDVLKAAEKVVAAGNDAVWLTERGTSFGYHDLVVDYRGLVIMGAGPYPVIFDATHSVQQPSVGAQSGGRPEFIVPLARAAVAVGVSGIFFETHPNPASAKSDAATQLPLSSVSACIDELVCIWSASRTV